MFASGQILFRISPDRVTGELAAALGGCGAARRGVLAVGRARARFPERRGRVGCPSPSLACPSLAWFRRSILPAWPAR